MPRSGCRSIGTINPLTSAAPGPPVCAGITACSMCMCVCRTRGYLLSPRRILPANGNAIMSRTLSAGSTRARCLTTMVGRGWCTGSRQVASGSTISFMCMRCRRTGCPSWTRGVWCTMARRMATRRWRAPSSTSGTEHIGSFARRAV